MVDMAFCSSSLFHLLRITGQMHMAESWRTGSYDIHGYNIPFAAKVKQAVTKSKVAVIGGVNDSAMCEDAIREGKTDFVIIFRQAIADPEFANKAREGREDSIRKCIRCYNCYPGPNEHESEGAFPPPGGLMPPLGGNPPPLPGQGPGGRPICGSPLLGRERSSGSYAFGGPKWRSEYRRVYHQPGGKPTDLSGVFCKCHRKQEGAGDWRRAGMDPGGDHCRKKRAYGNAGGTG